MSVMEIGSSAFQLGTTKQQRKEAINGVGRIRRLRVPGVNGGQQGPSQGNLGDQDDDDDDIGTDDIPLYPRSMLLLEVSDGFSVMKAIEYKRIPALELGGTALGSKVSC